MFTFTDDERKHLSEMRAISTDQGGNEVLVGLDVDESAFCMQHRRRLPGPNRDREGKQRYLELMKKHEVARLNVLGAEIQKRNDNPTLQ